MIQAKVFFDAALDAGIDFYTGVPCSFLTPLINRAISDPRTCYVGATSEGEAIAIAAGAWLAGRKTLAMMQNSGLGNAVNPLTSLNYPFRIPTLLVTTWRGQPGVKDEPQHEIMGRITNSLLELMRFPVLPFPQQEEMIVPILETAQAEMLKTGLPFALVMQKDSVAEEVLQNEGQLAAPTGRCQDLCRGVPRQSRVKALEHFLQTIPETAAVIATTGKTGRELFTLDDREQHLYLVGSMGGASAVGLGVALNADRPVIVLDGDGAALMKMGNMATVGAYRPRNLIHIILNNGVHDSTGGQATVAGSVNFAAVAAACGYRDAVRCDDLADFDAALRQALDQQDGPTLIELVIAPGSLEKLGRPTVKPSEVAARFSAFLAN
jgi:phosphonopyruvate decarboxylase